MSSSGHLALLPHLLGWRYRELPGSARKTFEVAVHAGSAPALVLALRGEDPPDPRLLPLTLAPPALAGLLLERVVEERLGGARSVAGGAGQGDGETAESAAFVAGGLARSSLW